jgi:hypothetical protein
LSIGWSLRLRDDGDANDDDDDENDEDDEGDGGTGEPDRRDRDVLRRTIANDADAVNLPLRRWRHCISALYAVRFNSNTIDKTHNRDQWMMNAVGDEYWYIHASSIPHKRDLNDA